MTWIIAIVLAVALWLFLNRDSRKRDAKRAQEEQSKNEQTAKRPTYSLPMEPSPNPDLDATIVPLVKAKKWEAVSNAYLHAWNSAEDRFFDTGDDAIRAAAFVYKQNQIRSSVLRFLSDVDLNPSEFILYPGATDGCTCKPILMVDFLANPNCLPCTEDCPCDRIYFCDPIIKPII